MTANDTTDCYAQTAAFMDEHMQTPLTGRLLKKLIAQHCGMKGAALTARKVLPGEFDVNNGHAPLCTVVQAPHPKKRGGYTYTVEFWGIAPGLTSTTRKGDDLVALLKATFA